MNESAFEAFLIKDEGIISKNKAVSSRMSKTRSVENEFGMSLDSIVQADISMYQTLIAINQRMSNGNGSYSNALRKYYIYKNGREFPRIRQFESENKHLL